MNVFSRLFQRFALEPSQLRSATDKNEKLTGVRVHMHEPDGLGPNRTLPDAYIEQSMPNGDYLARFCEPVVVDGQSENFVILSARHRGFPLSRIASGGVIASNAVLEQSQTGFIVTLKKS